MIREDLADILFRLGFGLRVRFGRRISLLRLIIFGRHRRIGKWGFFVEVAQLGVAGVGFDRIVAIGRRVQEGRRVGV